MIERKGVFCALYSDRGSHFWLTPKVGGKGAANRFLREEYIAEFNRRFQVAPRQRGNAFVPCRSRDLERIFSLQFERSVNRDNTVSFQNPSLQIERVRWRATLAGCQRCIKSCLWMTMMPFAT